MPSVIESPSGRMPEKAPRWDLTGTEGCIGGKVVLLLPLMFFGYLRIYRWKKYVGGVTRGPQGWGRALPPWARLPTLWLPCGFPGVHSKPSGCLLVGRRAQ